MRPAADKYRQTKNTLHIIKRAKKLHNQIAPVTYQQALKLKQNVHREQHLLKLYQNHVEDTECIVITNWSENDLRDSNNELIDNDDLKTWRLTGCKVYGRLGSDPNAENPVDNRGYFANFNYPINIIKAPNIYYFNSKQLDQLYASIKAHNPKLGYYLVNMAKQGTIPVHTFKTIFGLSARQTRIRLKRAKQAQEAGTPDPRISSLQKYYQWLLTQRKKNDLPYHNQDLSAYNVDESDSFNQQLYADKHPDDAEDDTFDDDDNAQHAFNGYSRSDIMAGGLYNSSPSSDTQNGDV